MYSSMKITDNVAKLFTILLYHFDKCCKKYISEASTIIESSWGFPVGCIVPVSRWILMKVKGRGLLTDNAGRWRLFKDGCANTICQHKGPAKR